MIHIKKAALAAALCAVFCHQPAIAGEETGAKGWSVRSTDPAIAKALAGAALKEGEDIAAGAARLQQLAADATGIVSLDTRVDADTLAITIEAAPIVARGAGAYGAIFQSLSGKPLTRADLDAKARLAQEAARYDNLAVSVKLEPASAAGEPMALVVETTPAQGPTAGGAVSITTYGQRYSGRDVATISGYAALGSQTQIQASLSKGLSGLRADSRGGSYLSSTAEIDHVFPGFAGSLKFNDTRYKMGGPLASLDQRGHIRRLDAEGRLPLSAETTLLFGGGVVSQDMSFGTAGLTESSSFRYGMAGLAYSHGCISASAKLYQGLGGSRSYNVSPLGGAFDPKFTALALDARCGLDLGSGWSAELSGAAQLASKNTPSAMQFYGGGPDRGRAFNTGNISGPSGVAGSATLAKDIGGGWSLYAGADAARVSQVVGPAQRQASAFVGARADLGKRGTLDIGVAKPFAAPPGQSRKPQLSLTYTLPF